MDRKCIVVVVDKSYFYLTTKGEHLLCLIDIPTACKVITEEINCFCKKKHKRQTQ